MHVSRTFESYLYSLAFKQQQLTHGNKSYINFNSKYMKYWFIKSNVLRLVGVSHWSDNRTFKEGREKKNR